MEEDYSNRATATTANKRKRKISPSTEINTDIDSNFAFFDGLTADLVLEIISKLGSTASCPAHFFSLRLTSKRLYKLGLDSTVLSKLSPNVFACRGRNLGPEAIRFMNKCVQAVNIEAIFTLGMIRFYIDKDYEVGKTLIGNAARRQHLLARYNMAIIHFNRSGSGGRKNKKVALDYLVRAAVLGHVDAIRELGSRVKEISTRYSRNYPEEGRRILLQATAREIVSRLPLDTIEAGSAGRGRISISVPKCPCLETGRWLTSVPRGPRLASSVSESDLTVMTDFGWDIPDPIPHPVNCLLTEWFEIQGGGAGNELRLCSRVMCGRPETRENEFLRCPLCRVPCYCSRACQSADWKNRHHLECIGNHIYNGDDGEENNEDIALDGI